MIAILKKIFIPLGEKVSVDGLETYVVRWNSFYLEKDYGLSTKRLQAELFVSKEDADKFANQLREAISLLRYTGDGTYIQVELNKI